MARNHRPVVLVNMDTGERKEYASVYELAKEFGVSTQGLTQTIERNGEHKGWKLYDHPDTLRARIEELKRQLAELEGEEL